MNQNAKRIVVSTTIRFILFAALAYWCWQGSFVAITICLIFAFLRSELADWMRTATDMRVRRLEQEHHDHHR